MTAKFATALRTLALVVAAVLVVVISAQATLHSHPGTVTGRITGKSFTGQDLTQKYHQVPTWTVTVHSDSCSVPEDVYNKLQQGQWVTDLKCDQH